MAGGGGVVVVLFHTQWVGIGQSHLGGEWKKVLSTNYKAVFFGLVLGVGVPGGTG